MRLAISVGNRSTNFILFLGQMYVKNSGKCTRTKLIIPYTVFFQKNKKILGIVSSSVFLVCPYYEHLFLIRYFVFKFEVRNMAECLL